MRGKKAKALRRMAQQATIGKPDRLLIQFSKSGIVAHHPDTTRRLMQTLKRRGK